MKTKIVIKSYNQTPFGGIFYVLNQFDRFLGAKIDKELGLRCGSVGYQYSEIFCAIFSIYFCGGIRIEDINAYLKDDLLSRPNTRVPSSNTILKAFSELATDNIEYTSNKGNTYSFNSAEKLNDLLVKLLLQTGQLESGQAYDVYFDHQYIQTEKFDAKWTYKKFKGYGPGITTTMDLRFI